MDSDAKITEGLKFTKETLSKKDFFTLCESKKKKILLTWKPKEVFHMGNVWMLHKIRQFLEKGFTIEIIIMVFDDCSNSSKILQNKVEYTYNFLIRWFENTSNVKVRVEKSENCPKDQLDVYYTKWKKIYKNHKEIRDENSISRLINNTGQFWVSDVHTYIPRCIWVYTHSEADIVICGEKHNDIVSTFRDISNELELNFPKILYIEDFPNLNNSRPMDTANDKEALVTLEDNDFYIFDRIIKLKRDIRKNWLNAVLFKILLAKGNFSICDREIVDSETFNEIFGDAPECIYGIVMAEFIKLVNEYRKQMEQLKRCYKITWNGKKDWEQQTSVECILRSIFPSENVTEILINKEFSEGKGGARVMQVDLFENERLMSSKIIKIGDSIELAKEKLNYENNVSGSKTSAFVSINEQSERIGGQIGIVYEHASTLAGNNVISLQQYIFENITKFREGKEKILHKIDQLFAHLNKAFYSHASFVDKGTYGNFYNNILPSLVEVELIKVCDSKGIKDFDGVCEFEDEKKCKVEEENWFKVIEILKLNDKEMVVIDDLNNKIKVFFHDNCPYLKSLRDYSNGKNTFFIIAKIKNTRKLLFEELIKSLPTSRNQKEKLRINRKVLMNPICVLYQILDRKIANISESIIHGDLNLNNILIPNETNELNMDLVLIDYQFTTRGFTSFDFIKLEMELRTHFLKDNNYIDYINFEELLLGYTQIVNNNSLLVANTVELIMRIRQKYGKIVDKSELAWQHYYVGIYFYSLRCLEFYASDKLMKRKLRFTASLYISESRILN